MPKIQPSQYDCDNMQLGDVVVVRHVSWLRKLYRHLVNPDLPKIRVRKSWKPSDDGEYITYYQEDCTLLYGFELRCVQKFTNVPCATEDMFLNIKFIKQTELDVLEVGLYNVAIKINGQVLSIPTHYFQNALEKNQLELKRVEDDRKFVEAVKFLRYKGDYFKNYSKEHNITEWIGEYCINCGKPIIFTFTDDKVLLDSYCECGCGEPTIRELSYNEFAIWYSKQTSDFPELAKYYGKTWFDKENEVS